MRASTAVSAKQQTEREELLGLLLERGILQRSETQPVLSRDGSSARWMLDSLAVTLTPRGAELAGRLVLERLQRFDGRQLAAYGLTAVPILQSAVLQSNGRYKGLLVRSERKPHGSQKLIEGQFDPDELVILIEDSIGRAFRSWRKQACAWKDASHWSASVGKAAVQISRNAATTWKRSTTSLKT
jgi:orotate phosphoribosyltransferase